MNVQFDELTQMASEQHGSGPDLQGLTSGQISLGLVLNQASSSSAKPPIKNDWDLLFQPMFDEYFKNPSVVSTPISAATLLPPDTARASSSSSTSIDKDASTSLCLDVYISYMVDMLIVAMMFGECKLPILIFTMVVLLSQDTLHKASAKRLDDNNAQATSQVTVVPCVDRYDKPHAKRTHRQTSNEIQKNSRPDISVIDTDACYSRMLLLYWQEHPGCQITRETVTTDQHD
ncbi:hypothetical protein Tco_0987535, partial [Tanacetum coccineum]